MARTGFSVLNAAVACAAFVAWCGADAAAVELKLKLEKGETYYQKTAVQQRVTQTVTGNKQVAEQNVGTGLEMEVLDVDPNENMRIQCTYIWSAFEQPSAMRVIYYDSSERTSMPPGAEGFAALLGRTFTLTLSPRGEVLDVNGVEQMRQAVLAALSEDVRAAPTMSAVMPFLYEESLSEMIASTMAVFPDRRVLEGNSWSRTAISSRDTRVIVQSKLTLQEHQAGMAAIEVTSSVEPDPNAPLTEEEGMVVQYELAGTEEGLVRLIERSGLIVSHQVRQQLKGRIRKAESAEDLNYGTTIPVEIERLIISEMSVEPWR